MLFKKCSKCYLRKTFTDENFPMINNGRKQLRSRRCRTCLRNNTKSHYQRHKEDYLRRSEAQRVSDPQAHRAYLRQNYRENREKRLEKMKITTSEGRAARSARSTKNYRKNPEKWRARNAVYRAVNAGKLLRPDNCGLCGKTGRVEAHHADYNKPLEVKWLCKQCHENEHHLNEGH